MMKSNVVHVVSIACLWLCCAASLPAAAETELSKLVASMDGTDNGIFTTGKLSVVSDGPGGRKVVCFEGKTSEGFTGRLDAKFAGRIDLKAKGVNPKDFDLIKLDVKVARGAYLCVSLENYPNPGELAHWYVLDTLRGASDWKTIWSENRKFWLGSIRFVKKAVDLDWDQSKAPYTWEKGKDLVFTYPLVVSNCLDRAVVAKLAIKPFQTKNAVAKLSQESVKLDPRARKEIQAEVRLPAAFAATAAPLYCEWFAAQAEAEGVADSTVTILRSSDPVHLSVTVPIAEAKLQFPLLPLPKTLPASVVQFDEKLAKGQLANDVDKIIQSGMTVGLQTPEGGGSPFASAIVSAAYLYQFTGDKKYLDVAAKLFGALPEIWKTHLAVYESMPVRMIGSGIVSPNTLSLGWRVGGTQRSPYFYNDNGNAKAGTCSSIYYAFDMIATELDPQLRQKVIAGFFLPAAIQSRNHTIGDGNQQATAGTTALLGGLLTRNWPLVSFVYSSEHGVQSIIDWGFTDEGLHLRKKYQTYSVRPLLWLGEIFYFRGIDLYALNRERFEKIVKYSSPEQVQFQDQYFWEFVEKQRLK